MLVRNLGSSRSSVGVKVGVPSFFDVLILERCGARFYMGINSALCVCLCVARLLKYPAKSGVSLATFGGSRFCLHVVNKQLA